MGEHPRQKEQQMQRPCSKMELAMGRGGMGGSSPSESKREAVREAGEHNKGPGHGAASSLCFIRVGIVFNSWKIS